jgi:hypothetical protein
MSGVMNCSSRGDRVMGSGGNGATLYQGEAILMVVPGASSPRRPEQHRAGS